jgi:hypothetical protein
MGSAGELTVWSLSAEASKAPLAGCQRIFAHEVALRPLADAQGAYPCRTTRLYVGWQTENIRLVYDTPAFASPLVTRATSSAGFGM